MANRPQKPESAERSDKSLDAASIPPELLQFRQGIDAIDSEIIALLKKRCEIVAQVGEFKRKQGAEGCFIRAGREADMVRHIWKSFSESRFNVVGAASIWRQIIAASTRIESDLRVAVYAPEPQEKLFWLAREYFGSFTTVTKHPNTNRVVGDVVNGKSEVGILPAFHEEHESDWWVILSQQEGNAPKVFAHVPFVVSKSESRRFSSYAIGHIAPEPTDDDVTLVAIHTNDISIHKLMSGFPLAGLKASRVQFINDSASGGVHHLLALEGFVAEDSKRLHSAIDKLGESVTKWKWLGAYARPILTTETC